MKYNSNFDIVWILYITSVVWKKSIFFNNVNDHLRICDFSLYCLQQFWVFYISNKSGGNEVCFKSV